MFSFSAIVGTQAGGCNGPGGDAQYAPRYIQVAQNTGGVVESICNANWGQTLANIGLNSFGLKRQFVLSSAPVAVPSPWTSMEQRFQALRQEEPRVGPTIPVLTVLFSKQDRFLKRARPSPLPTASSVCN